LTNVHGAAAGGELNLQKGWLWEKALTIVVQKYRALSYPHHIQIYGLKKRKYDKHLCFSYDLLTGRQIFYPFQKKDHLCCFLMETYCQGETDMSRQAGSPDFVTESWIRITF